MQAGIQKELWAFCFIMLCSALLGWSIGFLFPALLIATLAYLLWLLINISRLYDWVADGSSKESRPNVRFNILKKLCKEIAKQKKRQVKANKKYLDSNLRTSQLANAIDEGIVVLTDEFRLEWWNVAAGNQLSIDDSDKGHPLTGLIRDSEFLRYLEQPVFENAIELPSRIHKEKILSFKASHFGEGRIVLVILDITKLKNLERLRREFVGNVSHELRTPITVLKGYLETLGAGVVVDQSLLLKACSQMSGQVIRMQTLADDLIVLSRLESQPEEIPLEKVELQNLLDVIVKEAKVLSKDRHHISLDCPNQLFLEAQKSDLHSAFSNLLFNAVRHNPDGADISVSVQKNDDSISVSVKDNGVGISAEAIPKLTERFYRADRSRNSNVGGSGLGLAIVKHIINRYDGVLEISSMLGQGAEFVARFNIKSSNSTS